jgi:hypothetical protein
MKKKPICQTASPYRKWRLSVTDFEGMLRVRHLSALIEQEEVTAILDFTRFANAPGMTGSPD